MHRWSIDGCTSTVGARAMCSSNGRESYLIPERTELPVATVFAHELDGRIHAGAAHDVYDFGGVDRTYE